jgi:hypothetical protein
MLERGAGTGRCEAADAGREVAPVRDEHRRPRGTEGAHPGRSSYVRNVEIPPGSGPVVRQADREEGWIPRRAKDDREAKAGGRKATGNHDRMPVLQLAVVDNRPDTGPGCPDAKAADAVR